MQHEDYYHKNLGQLGGGDGGGEEEKQKLKQIFWEIPELALTNFWQALTNFNLNCLKT